MRAPKADPSDLPLPNSFGPCSSVVSGSPSEENDCTEVQHCDCYACKNLVNLGFAVKVFHDGERQCSDDRTEEQQQQTAPVTSLTERSRNLGKPRLVCTSSPAAPSEGSACPSDSVGGNRTY